MAERTFHPATTEVDYSADEAEFLRAIDAHKARTGKPFPTWREVLGVVRALGYARASEHDLRLYRRGSRNGSAKLDEARVAAIKRSLADGVGGRTLARAYGVCGKTVARIRRGDAWTHVPWPGVYTHRTKVNER